MDMHTSANKTYFIRTTLLILFIAAFSPMGEGFNKKDLVLYARHHTSSQKPKICQIYSRSTKKHIQIFRGKVVASGDHGNEWSKLEKRSHTFGVVTIRGVKSNRYLCMSRRGKLVARKKLASDGSCRFIENITTAYWTSFRSETHPDWYVGFNGKSGRPKRGKKTSEHQEACNFLIRDHQAPDPVDTIPEHMRDLILNLQRKLLHGSSLTRRRRHRLQTEDPIDDGEDDVINALPDWIKQPPTNASPEEEREWIIRVRSVIEHLPPRTPSNITMSSSELDNVEPATSKPEQPRRRKHNRQKSNSVRSPRKRRRKQKSTAGSRPTTTPSRRKLIGEMSVPKTPVRSQRGEEPTEPPNIGSPKISNMRSKTSRKASRRRHRAEIDSHIDADVDGEPVETDIISNTDDLNIRREDETNVLNNKNVLSRTNNASKTAPKLPLEDLGRSKMRRGRSGRPRRTQ